MKCSIKKATVTIIALAILVGGIFLAIYLKQVADYKHAVSEISIEEISLSDIPNGVYIGECDVNFIHAKVEVTVHGGAITNIRILEHKNERGQAAEAVVEKIISEQRIDVDAVTGATNSSTVLKKAVENALKDNVAECLRDKALMDNDYAANSYAQDMDQDRVYAEARKRLK